jgi:hypothetical protein
MDLKVKSVRHIEGTSIKTNKEGDDIENEEDFHFAVCKGEGVQVSIKSDKALPYKAGDKLRLDLTGKQLTITESVEKKK